MNVLWIDPERPAPLCDVPWHGTAVVPSSGEVEFCCFSNAKVGNVNERSFEEIWNGPEMRRIRRALAEQKLPPECRTPSCPIYRGDQQSFLRERMGGRYRFEVTRTDDPHAPLRHSLSPSRVEIETAPLKITLHLETEAQIPPADIFAAIRLPDGELRFLPGLESYAVPCGASDAGAKKQTLTLLPTGLRAPGDHQLCIALFEPDSNPSVRSNCFWAKTEKFRL